MSHQSSFETPEVDEKMMARDQKHPEGLQTMITRSNGDVHDLSEDHVKLHNSAVVTNFIETCGMGRYQWQMFFTCGFGFFVDQMLVVSVGVVIPQITKQWNVSQPAFITTSLYAGSLVGALLCGFLLDIIGRKLVWQSSLFVVTIFTLAAAGSSSFTVLAVLLGLQTVGAGGNIGIDLTVFVESLPRAKAWLVTALALWWGIGNAVGGLIAWPLIVRFSCPADATPATCSSDDNMGWRYQYIVVGGLCFVMACIRVFLMKMEESPKWLVTQGDFEGAVDALRAIARINKANLDVSTSDFKAMPEKSHTSKAATLAQLQHVRALFATKLLALSTVGISLLWMCIGIAYPLFTLFLPYYLASHGARLGDGSTYQTYRDYAITSTVGIFGPILSAGLVEIPLLGRRRSMAVTALCAAAFAGAFTTVRSEASNLAFSSMLGFWQNAFYAVLYSYTPEVMPTAHRGTGCGLTLACGRIASLSAAFIAAYGNVTTSVPLWVVLGIYLLIAIVASFLPFEPKRRTADDEVY